MTDEQQDLKINTLENNQSSMSEKLDDLKKTMLAGFKDIKADFKAVRAESDKKYASKLTEKVVYSLVALGLVALFSELFKHLINFR